MENSSGLSDTTIVLNTDEIRNVCSIWNSAASKANLGSFDVKGAFAPLVENGIAVGYVDSLDKALKSVEGMVTKLSSLISTNTDTQEEIDLTTKSKATGGRNGRYSSGSGGGYDSTGAYSGAGSPIDTSQYDVKDTDSDLNIVKEFDDLIAKLDENEKLDLMTSLYSILAEDTQKYLYEDKYKTLLKQQILASPNINADLKKIISQMDENEVQVMMRKILVDNAEVSDFSQMVISIYDNEFKQEFKGATPADSFDSIARVYSYLAKEKDIQSYISKIYFGEYSSVDDYTIVFTRTLIDTLSEKAGISYEELLSDSRYSSALKEASADIAKSFTTLSINNKVSSKA